MTTLRQRRRAERFAQLLDEASGGRRHHLRTSDDDELAALLAIPRELAATPAPELDPEFRVGLRAMLVATAEREGIGATAAPPPAPAPRPAPSLRGSRARTAIIAGVAVGAVALTGMSTASENAVPGDPLYGLKRSTERAQLALASSDVGRGQLYLDFARSRLQEARLLASDIDRMLDDMDRDTSHGVRLLASAAANRNDLAALDAVEAFVAEQQAALRELADEVGRADRARVDQSLALLEAISQRVRDLRLSLERSCPSITSIDSLGPVPGNCVALPTPDALLSPPAAAPPAATQAPVTRPDTERPTDDADQAAPEADPARPLEPQPGPVDEGEPAETEQPAPPAEQSDAEEPDEGDGGLLGGLNRLLGNLLGNH